MLSTATRPYTDAELDEYTDRMVTGRAYGVTVIVTLALIVGAAAATITAAALWLTAGTDDWTQDPPELATDITATAYAAWRTESDELDTVFVFRVEPDQYLLITHNALTPHPLDDNPPAAPAQSIPSSITLVLLGQGPFRIAMNVALSGQPIPLKRVTSTPDRTSQDQDDETPVPDGLYTTRQLPARLRQAIGAQ